MRKYLFATIAAALLLPGVALAGSSATQQVTVTVSAINEAAITGGNVTLTISSATAGSNPTSATDSTTSLGWTTNEATKKITVATDNAAPSFTLSVQATACSAGTAAAAVTLSTTAADFITGIGQDTGSCTLSYTASATAASGTGSDVHNVTYTIVAGP